MKNLISSALTLTLSAALALAAPHDILKRSQSKMSIMTVGDLCVDGSDVSAITAKPCNNSDAQKWYFVRPEGRENDAPYHDRIYNAAHGKDVCLDAVGLLDSDDMLGRSIIPVQLTTCDVERTYSSQIWHSKKLSDGSGFGLAAFGTGNVLHPVEEGGRIVLKVNYIKPDGTDAIPSSGVIGHVEEFVPEYISH